LDNPAIIKSQVGRGRQQPGEPRRPIFRTRLVGAGTLPYPHKLGPLLHQQAEAAGAEFVLDTVENLKQPVSTASSTAQANTYERWRSLSPPVFFIEAVLNKLPATSRCILFRRILTIVYLAQNGE
jgi:hypothetical protein